MKINLLPQYTLVLKTIHVHTHLQRPHIRRLTIFLKYAFMFTHTFFFSQSCIYVSLVFHDYISVSWMKPLVKHANESRTDRQMRKSRENQNGSLNIRLQFVHVQLALIYFMNTPTLACQEYIFHFLYRNSKEIFTQIGSFQLELWIIVFVTL